MTHSPLLDGFLTVCRTRCVSITGGGCGHPSGPAPERAAGYAAGRVTGPRTGGAPGAGRRSAAAGRAVVKPHGRDGAPRGRPVREGAPGAGAAQAEGPRGTWPADPAITTPGPGRAREPGDRAGAAPGARTGPGPGRPWGHPAWPGGGPRAAQRVVRYALVACSWISVTLSRSDSGPVAMMTW